MILDQQQISFINENEWVVFATAGTDAAPRAAIVMPSRVEPDRIIISDVQMMQSAENVKNNPRVFVSSYKGDTQIKISGAAEYFDAGALFDEIKEFEKTRDVDVKGIIIVGIQSVEQTDG